MESDSPQFLKYNFVPFSSGFCRSSFRRSKKRHNQSSLNKKETKSDAIAINISSSFIPKVLVPILKTSPSYQSQNPLNPFDKVEDGNSPKTSMFLKRHASDVKGKLFPNHSDSAKRPREAQNKCSTSSHRTGVWSKSRMTTRFIKTVTIYFVSYAQSSQKLT